MKRYRNAAEDLERLLQLEPNNKKAQEQLNKLQTEFLKKKQKESAITRGGGEEKSEKKGRRIQIKEVEGSGSEEEGASPVVSAPPPLPPQVEDLKERGNRQFRNGQYGDAVVLYTRAIKLLEIGMHVDLLTPVNVG